MKLALLLEDASDIGHMGLDIAGLAPGIGEAADLVNAMWYAKQGQYTMAGLSVLSAIPGVGDIVAKGTKYLASKSPEAAVYLAKLTPIIARHWGSAKTIMKKSSQLQKYSNEIDAAITKMLKDAKSRAPEKKTKFQEV